MLRIGGDDFAKIDHFSPFFDVGGDDLAKLTRLQMSNFLPEMK